MSAVTRIRQSRPVLRVRLSGPAQRRRARRQMARTTRVLIFTPPVTAAESWRPREYSVWCSQQGHGTVWRCAVAETHDEAALESARLARTLHARRHMSRAWSLRGYLLVPRRHRPRLAA
jgi:hypothetical protein